MNTLKVIIAVCASLALAGCASSRPKTQGSVMEPRIGETLRPARTNSNVKAIGGAGSYASVVMRAYYRAWKPLDSWPSNEHVTRASVTVARDGRVISARIVGPSGDVWADKSVREALDKVRVVAPFENGAKEKSRTFIINFDSKTVDG